MHDIAISIMVNETKWGGGGGGGGDVSNFKNLLKNRLALKLYSRIYEVCI